MHTFWINAYTQWWHAKSSSISVVFNFCLNVCSKNQVTIFRLVWLNGKNLPRKWLIAYTRAENSCALPDISNLITGLHRAYTFLFYQNNAPSGNGNGAIEPLKYILSWLSRGSSLVLSKIKESIKWRHVLKLILINSSEMPEWYEWQSKHLLGDKAACSSNTLPHGKGIIEDLSKPFDKSKTVSIDNINWNKKCDFYW